MHFLVLSGLAMISGVAVAQSPAQSPVQIAVQTTAQITAQSVLPEPTPPPVPRPPLTLFEALSLLPRSPQWRALERSEAAARSGLDAVRRGALSLTVGTEADASRLSLPDLEPLWSSSSTVTIGASAAVLPWGSALDGIRSGQRVLERTRLDHHDARAELVSTLLERLCAVNTAVRDLEIARLGLHLAEERLRVAQDQRAAGTGTAADLLEVQAALEAARAVQAQAVIALSLARQALFALLGQAEREIAVLELPALAEVPGLTPAALEGAANLRSELRRADLSVLEAEDALNVAMRDRFVPQGSLSASLSELARDAAGATSAGGARLSGDLNLASGVLGLQGHWQPAEPAVGHALTLGLSLTFSLWSPGQDARIESARAALDAARLGREHTRVSVRLDLEARTAQDRLDALNLKSLEAQQATALRRLEDAETRLGLGLTTALERDAVRLSLLTARRDLERARVSALKSRLHLLAGLGKLDLEPPLSLPNF